ncbi:MAG TPA: GntR family transcriptional regulator, partial [Longimicrobiales bacterium]|nr:GntR family transcriptional regulator [Longimicrobiales bacterium]
IREALIELARDGLLDNSPNRGFLIPPFSVVEAAEIYPLMWALETLALRSAPPSPAQLEKLVEINTAYTVAEETKLADLDVQWHVELLRGCTNTTLLETIDQLRWRIRRYEIDYLRHSRWSAQAPVQHHAMVLALRRGDLDRTAELLELNWKQGLELVTTNLQK